MRISILPQLEDHFGKEVSGNLRRLGESARELSDYLSKKLKEVRILNYLGQRRKKG